MLDVDVNGEPSEPQKVTNWELKNTLPTSKLFLDSLFNSFS